MDDDPLVTELVRLNEGADREIRVLERVSHALEVVALCVSLGSLGVVIVLVWVVYWLAEIAKRL